MRRVLLYITLVYWGGLLTGTLFEFNPFYFIPPALICLSCSIIWTLKGRRASHFIYFTVFCAALFVSSYKLYMLESQNSLFNDQYVIIKGQISDNVTMQNNMTKYTLYVDNITLDGTSYKYDCNIRVIDYNNPGEYIIPYNEVSLSGKFQGNKQYKNLYGFYYDRFMLNDNVGAILIADYNPEIKSSRSPSRFFSHAVYNLKCHIEGIVEKYTDNNTSAVMKGVLFGDTSKIVNEDMENFKKAGIIHIFAVSGYNIWLIYFVLSYLLFFPKHSVKIKTIIIMIILFIYTLMSGCTPSVVRAFIIAAVMLSGKLIGKKADPLTSLSLGALMILIFNPLSIHDVGFQLSFMSVASMIFIFPELRKYKLPIHDKIKDMILTTISVEIGILPIIISNFNNIPLLSVLSNLFIIPLASLFTIAGLLMLPAGMLFQVFAQILGTCANFICSIMLWICDLLGSIPYSNLNVVSPNLLEIIIYYFAVAIVFKIIKTGEKFKKIFLSGFMLIILISIIIESFPANLEICFLDVGQGDSIYIRTPDKKHILIDGGGKTENAYSDLDIGRDVLIPFLYKKGVNRIDLMVSSHSHDDHLKGLVPVLNSFNTDFFVKTASGTQDSYVQIKESGLINNDSLIDVRCGDMIEAGQYVKLYILAPVETIEDDNDSSVVIKLVYNDFIALFTGDISSRVEEEILQEGLKSDILKIPHHGSITSLNNQFLDAVNPYAAIICVGRNSFGHPSGEVVKEIEKRGIKLYRTDINGEVDVISDGSGFEIKSAL